MVSMNLLDAIHDTARQQPQTSWHNQSSYLRWSRGDYHYTARKVEKGFSILSASTTEITRYRRCIIGLNDDMKGSFSLLPNTSWRGRPTSTRPGGFPRQKYWKKTIINWTGVIVHRFTKISQFLSRKKLIIRHDRGKVVNSPSTGL